MSPIYGFSIFWPFVGIRNACPHNIGYVGHILNNKKYKKDNKDRYDKEDKNKA